MPGLLPSMLPEECGSSAPQGGEHCRLFSGLTPGHPHPCSARLYPNLLVWLWASFIGLGSPCWPPAAAAFLQQSPSISVYDSLRRYPYLFARSGALTWNCIYRVESKGPQSFKNKLSGPAASPTGLGLATRSGSPFATQYGSTVHPLLPLHPP